jgi:hypothetical protein
MTMGYMQAADAILCRLATMDRAAVELRRDLAVLRDGIRVHRKLRERGLSLSDSLVRSPDPACHEVVARQIEILTEAVHDYRVEIVRSLVDEEGWTLADVARETGNARQVVSRLYHAADTRRCGVRPNPKIRLRASPGLPNHIRRSAPHET